MNEEVIERPRLISQARGWIGNNLIKIVSGQRRVGKSFMLRAIAEVCRREHPQWRTVFIDKELSACDHVRDAAGLERAAASEKGERVALFLDEAQELEGFPRALHSLAAGGLHEIWVTGSNARLLSGEIASLFAGRTATLRVRSLEYGEFLRFHGRTDSEESLGLYLRYGGLPFLRNLHLSDETAFEYLRGVFDAIVLKDIVQRHRVRNPAILGRIVEFIADSIGSPVSARNVANYLKSKGVECSPQTVLDYFAHLCGAHTINRVRAEDLGMRSVARGFDQRDIGKVIENAVFLKLADEGWHIRSGRTGEREIDFVCDRAGNRMYVQAAYLLPDGATREREFASLLALRDAWPRCVVSLDPLRAGQEGVRHLGLREFLLAGAQA